MKKPQLILNAVFGAALITLFVLFFFGRTSKEPAVISPSGDNAVLTGDGSIVYIQLDSLINSYDLFHDLKAELEVKASAAENDLNTKGRAFERKAIDFQEKMQKGLITRSQAEQLQAQLQQEELELRQYAEKLQQDMAEEEAVAMRRVYDAVMTYLEAYNVEHNHSLILSTSGSTNTVMQGALSLNITKIVLDELNAGYISEKNTRK